MVFYGMVSYAILFALGNFCIGKFTGIADSPFPVFWCTGIFCNDPEIVDELILDHRVYKREGVETHH
jgi:hypothetical protein